VVVSLALARNLKSESSVGSRLSAGLAVLLMALEPAFAVSMAIGEAMAACPFLHLL